LTFLIEAYWRICEQWLVHVQLTLNSSVLAAESIAYRFGIG